MPLVKTPEATPDRVAVALAKIGLALRTHAWDEAGRRGLTPTQGQVLTVVRARGALRIGALAAELGVTAPTVSDAVAALEAKRLVTRRADPADRRATEVRLTPAGHDVAGAAAAWPEAIAIAVADLDAAEQAVLLKGLLGVIRALQRRGRIPVARMCVTCRYFAPDAHPGSDHPHHCRFVDAPLADGSLRVDCDDFEPAEDEQAQDAWTVLAQIG